MVVVTNVVRCVRTVTRVVTSAWLAVVVLMMPVSAGASLLLAFPQATLEEERAITSPAHRVMLSAIREVGNEIRAESDVKLAVDGTGSLYQLNNDASRQDARRWYLEQLQTHDATILFRCEGRQCGRSNVWANQVFDQSTLYGRDSNQDYLVAALEDDNGQRWLISLYTVTRGNQRDYVWLEQLRLAGDAVVPGFDSRGGRVFGPVVVAWEGDISIRLDWDVETRRLINDRARDPDTRLVIAAFSALKPDETVEQAIERAEKAAATMSDLLDRSGISRSRHIIRGLGPLVRSETPGRPRNRIELLVIAPPEGVSRDE